MFLRRLAASALLGLSLVFTAGGVAAQKSEPQWVCYYTLVYWEIDYETGVETQVWEWDGCDVVWVETPEA